VGQPRSPRPASHYGEQRHTAALWGSPATGFRRALGMPQADRWCTPVAHMWCTDEIPNAKLYCKTVIVELLKVQQ